MRCSSFIRRDHTPFKLCFSGSGLPMPIKGWSFISSRSLQIRFCIFVLPLFSQYFRSALACSRRIISIDCLCQALQMAFHFPFLLFPLSLSLLCPTSPVTKICIPFHRQTLLFQSFPQAVPPTTLYSFL